MPNEQTIPDDTGGDKVDTPVESLDAEYNKLKERNNKIQEELIRGEKLKTESLLGGDTGGHIQSKELTEEERKKVGAKTFFKGTALEAAIEKL